MVLKKAQLIPCKVDLKSIPQGQKGGNAKKGQKPAAASYQKDADKSVIEFMFNPTELKFSRSMNIEQSEGSRTEKGDNKVSFKHPSPYQLTISNVILDTYEGKDGKHGGNTYSVLDELKPFTEAVKYIKDEANSKPEKPSGKKDNQSKGEKKRPPIYLFAWGDCMYLRCFVKTLNFRLTMFLPDGTPVRAIVDLTLEQVDEKNPQPPQDTPKVSQRMRQANSRPGLDEPTPIL
jgi:hypothetical protein